MMVYDGIFCLGMRKDIGCTTFSHHHHHPLHRPPPRLPLPHPAKSQLD